MTEKKWVYLFSEVETAEESVSGDWEEVRALLGGKGAGLADMTRAGVPVPPGFTVTTEACNAYLDAGEKMPAGMWDQELEAMKNVQLKDDVLIGTLTPKAYTANAQTGSKAYTTLRMICAVDTACFRCGEVRSSTRRSVSLTLMRPAPSRHSGARRLRGCDR